MISTRGPNQIMVVDRTGVPVKEVCRAVIAKSKISETCAKFALSEDEVFAAIDAMKDAITIDKEDFIEFSITRTELDVHVETVGLTDCLFLSLVCFGKDTTESDEIDMLFANGISVVLLNFFKDLENGTDYYMHCDVSRMVAEEFERAYGPSMLEDLDILIDTLKRTL